jgi:pentatricopeptide repeat protein
MLPKVATHILHQTSRAVAAVQNQSGYTIRNVLQLQTQSTPTTTGSGIGSWNGAGSSSWGSSGAGPGGAKYNAGSRFYSGYTVSVQYFQYETVSNIFQGAGRAVTQANSSTASDGTNGQSDDNDEVTLNHIPRHRQHGPRARSHSLSIEGRQERGEKLGVLKTVQMHTRSKHTFATAAPSENAAMGVPHTPTSDVVLVRRNSTSAPIHSDSLESILTSLPSISPTTHTLPATDPAAPQSTTEPVLERTEDAPTDLFLELKEARNKRDAPQVLQLVERMRTSSETPHTAEFNMALEALHESRQLGEPLNILLDTYNGMIKRSVVPNIRTYLILILALTDRDREVHKTIMGLEARTKRRLRSEPVQNLPEQQLIEQLRSENNFGSAMSLFEAASAIARNNVIIPLVVYNNLIRSCAYHSNIDAAIHVFAHLERRSDLLPSAATFSRLISVYTNIGDLRGAKDVFDEYRAAAKENRILRRGSSNSIRSFATSNLIVWNRMIEAYFRCGEHVDAMNLLEIMMDKQTSTEVQASDVPPPAASTFTEIIAGFCQGGDVPSALSWFNRLLEQDATARHPHECSYIPPRPDQIAWMVMLEALAFENMVPDMNRLFGVLVQNATRDGLEIRATDRLVLFEANMRYLDGSKGIANVEAIKILDFLVQNVLTFDDFSSPVKLLRAGRKKVTDEIVDKYIQFGDPIRAFNLIEPFVQSHLQHLQQAESLSRLSPAQMHDEMGALRDTVVAISIQMLQPDVVKQLPVSFKDALRVLRLSDATHLLPSRSVASYYLNAYAFSKARGEVVELKLRDWELLVYASTSLELPHDERVPKPVQLGTAALLEDMQKYGVDLERFGKTIVRRIVKAVFLKYGVEELQALFSRLGPDYERVLNNPERDGESLRAALQHSSVAVPKDAIQVAVSQKPIVVDVYHSRYVEEFFPNHPTVSPLLAYSRFEAGVAKGIYPIPSAIGRLINALGRLKEMDKVRTLYDAGQLVISTLETESDWQSKAWFMIEDQMIISCAHAGEMDAALQHRQRMTQHGGIPSADAYGALIECVKDTTDDTSNAVSLYYESQAVGCTPNVYLFNTIISKLAKARKADFALSLFQEMKAIGVKPSSITYGAVIAACARVGDAMSAEQLFREMSEQPNFKPRIPPYNTMMQLYTLTKPNRERVIQYYQLLLDAQIPPSGHTYKVSSVVWSGSIVLLIWICSFFSMHTARSNQ